MNYDEQRKYLRGSRVWGALVALPFLVPMFFVMWEAVKTPRFLTFPGLVFAAASFALSYSIFYTPDYLHLSVAPNKPNRWQVKIRSRIAGAIAVLSLIIASTWRGRLEGILFAAVIAALSVVGARLVRRSWLAEIYAITDLILIAIATMLAWPARSWSEFLLFPVFHLWAVIGNRHRWYALSVSSTLAVLVYFAQSWTDAPPSLVLYLELLLATLGTVLLVTRAQRRHAKNRASALRELTEYTHRSAEDVERMWQTSNQQLAANWEAAKLAPDDRAALAKWYADNSELYLFAISAYNLEYRRIKSNLFVLDYGRGHAIDYGAGNGELVLEMARRGQRAAYYDVDGATLRFARWRAQQRGLEVEFFTEKPPLAALARERPFDTVFSFDVLEHIPDLAAELDFLSSLLAPGGQMVFDLPTGATKAHPMHLEHHLDFRKHLEAKGLRERKRWADYLPFRKQEKFVFVK